MTRLAALLVALPVVAAAQPAAPAPPPTKLPPVYDRDLVSGPIAGLPGYTLTVTNSSIHCGGKKLVVTWPKARPTTDTEVIAVFELEFPTGLSFDPAPAKKALRESSLKRFKDFVGQMTKTGATATTHYSAQIAATKDREASYAAAARLLQMSVHTARLLAYAEIPKDVRTGEFKDEKIDAFCDQMAAVAEPIDARAREALTRCQAGAPQFASTWWAPLCATP